LAEHQFLELIIGMICAILFYRASEADLMVSLLQPQTGPCAGREDSWGLWTYTYINHERNSEGVPCCIGHL